MMSSNGAMSAEFDFKAAFHREHADLCKVESRNYVLKQRIKALELALEIQEWADGTPGRAAEATRAIIARVKREE